MLKGHGENGFTLLEMLVALAIMALAAGVAFPALTRLWRRSALDESTTVLRLALADARADAWRQDRAVAMRIDGGSLVSTSGRTARRLPEGVSMRMPGRGITFFADHSSTGGSVTIETAQGMRILRVSPATAGVEGVQ